MPYVASYTEIRPLIKAHFPKTDSRDIKILDDRYSIPSRDWLTKTFVRHFKKYQDAYGLRFWETDSWDCDNFALDFMVEAQKAHALSSGGKKNSSLSVGIMRFNSLGTGGVGPGPHIANVAIVGDSQGMRVLTLEPQNGWTTELIAQERDSCDFVLM